MKALVIATLLTLIVPETSSAAETGGQNIIVEVLSEKTPMNYSGPKNNGGEATRLVKAILTAADIQFDIKFIPWKRVYRKVLDEPNRLVYPLAKTSKRLNLFEWVGQITPVHYYLFKLNSRQALKAMPIAEVKAMKVGVVNQHAHHEYLIAEGFTRLRPVNNSLLNVKKLKVGRVDLLAMSSAGLRSLCEAESLNCKDFVPLIKLKGISTGLFLAYSKGSDKLLIERTKDSYNRLVASGEFDRIMGDRANRQYQDIFLDAFANSPDF